MRRFYTRRRFRRRSNGPRLQHSPSTMDQALATNIAGIVLLATPNSTAGSSAGTAREGADRDREVNAGSRVNSMVINLNLDSVVGQGFLEIGIVKVQRQFAVPAIGTDPIPSSATITSIGLQQALRMNMPGWVLQYHTVPLTASVNRQKIMKVNLAKFKMAAWRDGDYLAVVLFNRTNNSVNYSVQARYYEQK